MKKVGIFIIIASLVIFLLVGLNFTDGKFGKDKIFKEEITKELIMDELVGMNIEDAKNLSSKVGINLEIKEEYNFDIPKDEIISQNIEVGSKIEKDSTVIVTVSLGSIPTSIYEDNKVNELGNVPIMMYHGIVDMKNSDTKYTGGNVDKDGYNRTTEAFREDLEFYYQSGYRMIRLTDYVDGNINVELGKSPIILTFDDGNKNNFNVLGEENGNLIIDPNCAVGILEEFKLKYPNYNVTATFFVNSGLFEQSEYNEKILIWLIDNGYDIGNHTMTHVDFTKVSIEKTMQEVGGIYQKLGNIIPNKYVNIVALPFGSPYNLNHSNYSSILNGDYNGTPYQTKAALRVGWEAEVSPFNQTFNPHFLKRIRAYDNNEKEFDIKMNFKLLETKRYISDGDINTIVVHNADKDKVKDLDKRIITY